MVCKLETLKVYQSWIGCDTTGLRFTKKDYLLGEGPREGDDYPGFHSGLHGIIVGRIGPKKPLTGSEGDVPYVSRKIF